jgi:excisionase family DNA binding protein
MRSIARLMKAPEVAVLFHVKPGTVVKWARIGKIAAVKAPGGRGYLFHPDDVAALMDTELATAIPQNEIGPVGAANTGQAL